jgi:TRAP-type C4-dicarboxylate transport system permease small subunit
MTTLLAATTSALPSNTGYVAAAYLVFFALVLIYLVIMATKLARFERELAELNELADRAAAPAAHDADPEAIRS